MGFDSDLGFVCSKPQLVDYFNGDFTTIYRGSTINNMRI